MIYFDYDDVKFYLSSYSSIVGIASILISVEFGMDIDSLELKNQYLIKNIYYKDGSYSLEESAIKSIDLISNVKDRIVSYSNKTNTFFRYLKNIGKEKFEDYRVTSIDYDDAYQIINSLIYENRIVFSEDSNHLQVIFDRLQYFNLENNPDPVIYALFHSIAVIEHNRVGELSREETKFYTF